MVADGTTAPVGSVTVPVRDVVCPNAAVAINKANARTHRSFCMFLLLQNPARSQLDAKRTKASRNNVCRRGRTKSQLWLTPTGFGPVYTNQKSDAMPQWDYVGAT